MGTNLTGFYGSMIQDFNGRLYFISAQIDGRLAPFSERFFHTDFVNNFARAVSKKLSDVPFEKLKSQTLPLLSFFAYIYI